MAPQGLSRRVSIRLLLLITALLPFQELGRLGPIGLRPFEIGLLLATVVALPAVATRPRDWIRPRLVDREVVAVVLLGVLALTLAPGPGDGPRVFRLVLLEPALYYFLATRLLPGRDGARSLAAALAVGGVATAMVGLGQIVTQEGLIEAEGVDRIRAAYRSPNNLALFLDRVVPLAGAMALGMGGAGWWVAFAAVTGALALTYSVGGWLASGVGLALAVWLVRGRRALLALGLLGLLAVGVVFLRGPERVTSKLELQGESTSALRVLVWGSSLEMLRDHPIVGIGLDRFVYLYNPERGGTYMHPDAWREPDLSHPHNLLLDWWLSLGLPGALLLGWLLVRWARLARAAWAAAAGDLGARAVTSGVIGAFAAGLVHGTIDNSFFLPDLAVLWWLGYVMLGGLAGSIPSSSAEGRALERS